MAKTITLEYNGAKYTLEFTRRSVKQIEAQGFNINEMDSKFVTTFEALVRGAFLAHHRGIPNDIVEEIYEHVPNKESFIEKLAVMYAEPLEALMAEPSEDMGKATWETSW